MKLVMIGTGSPRPTVERAGSSQLIVVGDQHYLVDCGDGTTTNLLRAGISLARVTRLFFTHLHSDHTLGYGQFLIGGWAGGRRELQVIGTPGVARLHRIHVDDLYRRDIEYRIGLGRTGAGITDVQVREVEGGEVYRDDWVEVTAVPVIHDVFTLALRFQAGDRAIVLSGDTAYCPGLVELAAGADILVHDACMAPNATYRGQDLEHNRMWQNLRRYHATPAEAARTAREAGVRCLVLTHFLPGTDEDQVLAEARAEFDGEIHVAHDLLTVECQES